MFGIDVAGVILAAAEGCHLCKWLLDDEWIHRSIFVERKSASLKVSTNHKHRGLRDVLQDAHEEWTMLNGDLPSSRLENTLRYLINNKGGQLDNLVLGAHPHYGFAWDLLELQCFVWYDQAADNIVYRSRHGFSVFSNPGKSEAFFIAFGNTTSCIYMF